MSEQARDHLQNQLDKLYALYVAADDITERIEQYSKRINILEQTLANLPK